MKYMFKRTEEKFIVDLSTAKDIQTRVKADLDFSEFNSGGSLVDIRTTYLENDDFLIFHLKKNKQKKRYKVRIREYGKDGHFESVVWVELKEKVNGMGYKSRFKIDKKYIEEFFNGYNVFSYVLLENRGIDSDYLLTLYNRIQDLIQENNLYPRLVMQYERLALQGEDAAGVRLTFDYNLKGAILNHKKALFSSFDDSISFDKNKSITELKTGSLYPAIANSFKEEFSLNKQKFSKFMYGMESLYTGFNDQSDLQLKEYIPMTEIIVYEKEFAI